MKRLTVFYLVKKKTKSEYTQVRNKDGNNNNYSHLLRVARPKA